MPIVASPASKSRFYAVGAGDWRADIEDYPFKTKKEWLEYTSDFVLELLLAVWPSMVSVDDNVETRVIEAATVLSKLKRDATTALLPLGSGKKKGVADGLAKALETLIPADDFKLPMLKKPPAKAKKSTKVNQPVIARTSLKHQRPKFNWWCWW